MAVKQEASVASEPSQTGGVRGVCVCVRARCALFWRGLPWETITFVGIFTGDHMILGFTLCVIAFSLASIFDLGPLLEEPPRAGARHFRQNPDMSNQHLILKWPTENQVED